MKKILSLILMLFFMSLTGCNEKEIETKKQEKNKATIETLSDEVKNNFNKTLQAKDITLNKNLVFFTNKDGLVVNTFKTETTKKARTKIIKRIRTAEDLNFSGEFYYNYNGIIIKGTAKNGKVDGLLEAYEKKDNNSYSLKSYSIFDNGNITEENYIYVDKFYSDLFDYSNKKRNWITGVAKSNTFDLFYKKGNSTHTFFSEDGVKMLEIVFEEGLEKTARIFDTKNGNLKEEYTIYRNNIREIDTKKYENGQLKEIIEEKYY